MKNLHKGIVFSLLLLVTTTLLGNENNTTKEVQKAYNQWTHAIESAKGDPKPVVSLYAPKAILLATLAPMPLTTPEEMDKYFAKLTSYKNMSVETKQMLTQIFPDVAINSGIYVFHFIDNHNKPVALNARFSFVYHHETDGKWLIVNHHSSVVPNP